MRSKISPTFEWKLLFLVPLLTKMRNSNTKLWNLRTINVSIVKRIYHIIHVLVSCAWPQWATRSWSGEQCPTNTSVSRRFPPLISGIHATNSWLWNIFVQCHTMSLSILLRSSKYHWKLFKTMFEKMVFWMILQCNRFRNGGIAQKILTSCLVSLCSEAQETKTRMMWENRLTIPTFISHIFHNFVLFSLFWSVAETLQKWKFLT